MTDAEAMRLLRRAGWKVVRQGRTSHMLMRRGDERRVFAVGRLGKHRVSRTARHEILKAAKGAAT